MLVLGCKKLGLLFVELKLRLICLDIVYGPLTCTVFRKLAFFGILKLLGQIIMPWKKQLSVPYNAILSYYFFISLIHMYLHDEMHLSPARVMIPARKPETDAADVSNDDNSLYRSDRD